MRNRLVTSGRSICQSCLVLPVGLTCWRKKTIVTEKGRGKRASSPASIPCGKRLFSPASVPYMEEIELGFILHLKDRLFCYKILIVADLLDH